MPSHTLQLQVLPSEGLRLTFDPNIPAGSNGKDQQEPDEQEGFQIICRNAFCREYHSPNELALRSAESSTKDNAQATPVWGLD